MNDYGHVRLQNKGTNVYIEAIYVLLLGELHVQAHARVNVRFCALHWSCFCNAQTLSPRSCAGLLSTHQRPKVAGFFLRLVFLTLFGERLGEARGKNRGTRKTFGFATEDAA